MKDYIGPYEIIKEIGRGGMARVYLAHDPNLDIDVAVKLMHRHLAVDRDFSARFRREAKIIASLRHTAVVRVYTFGEVDHQLYLAMEYMSGGSLRQRLQRLKNRRISVKSAMETLEQIGPALDRAHAKGVVHRDIKPGNILFDEYGSAFVSDFGIAKLAQSANGATSTGLIGTPTYMSPEQAMGENELDGRSDQYSLAVMLFEALTGSPVFKGDTTMKLVLARLIQPAPDIRAIRKKLPEGLSDVFKQALEKDPRNRFGSVGEFVEEFRKAVVSATAVADEWPERKKSKASTHKLLWPRIQETFRSAFSRVPKLAIGVGLAFLFVIGLLFAPLPSAIREDGHRMALVPAGTFIMGSNVGSTDQRPVHDVFLDSYYIDVNEVTNDQYAAFLNDVGTRPYSGTLIGLSNNAWRAELFSGNLPVVDVNWLDADAFCKWRGGRLPTEAEWEKAARGTDGRAFPWGIVFEPDRGNFRDEAFRVLPVGTFPQGASPYGVLDLSGNVWELVNDWYDANYYRESPQANPIGPFNGVDKVRRGGSAADSQNTSLLRATNRNAISPFDTGGGVTGFRCAEPVVQIPILYWFKAD